MKSINDRLYTRNGRYYGNFSDLGGSRRKALIPPGERKGTQDFDVAYQLAATHVDELTESAESDGSPDAGGDDMRWDAYARRHLERLTDLNKASSTIRRLDQSLRWFRKFLDERELGNILLREIRTALVSDFLHWRSGHPGVRAGTTLQPETIRNDMFALSGLLERAYLEEKIPHNPVKRVEKPKRSQEMGPYLEIIEGARLLLVAAWFDLYPSPRSIRFLEALIATMLIQGLRPSEAYALRIEDVDLERGVIIVRRRQDHRLKTKASARAIRIWPQYREIIEPHLQRRRAEGGSRLVFPSARGKPLTDIRGSFSTLLEAAGIEKPITPHSLRHTYASVRVQTLDHGEPVALLTVAKELGHEKTDLLQERYAHLLVNRRRLPYVEYRFTEAGEDPDT